MGRGRARRYPVSHQDSGLRLRWQGSAQGHNTDGELLVNEIAPRPHNSGHLTFDAAVTSQFEQQVRAICALPLGSTKLLTPAAAMANLLGELWEDSEPNWAAASRFNDVKLHLYGKAEARRGRKMGHMTAMGRTTGEALD